MQINDLPKKISIFPLRNFIIFPKTTVPLNIFEPRYIDMINDSMKLNKLIGMIQPKKAVNDFTPPNLHNIGCLGKITSFKETEDGMFLIELKGLIRFEIIKEIKTKKKYRECEVSFENFNHDLDDKREELKFSDLELIFKDLKSLFKKRGFIINWEELEKQNLNEMNVSNIMTKNPISIDKQSLAVKALAIMNEKKITSLCVHDKKNKLKTIGVLHIHNILQSNID